MDNRTISGIVAILLIATVFVTSVGTNPAKAVSNTITVPDDYSTIQEAINHASDGDTVFVRAGAYPENVIVNRTVSVLGENRETTINPPRPPGPGYARASVLVTAGNVTFEGFTVCDGNFGIQIQSSKCDISGNIFTRNNFEGVFLDGRNAQVNDNVVANNTMLNNYGSGTLVWTSNGNHIESNTIEDNALGIYIGWNSSRNMVERNEIFSESHVGIGLADNSFGNMIACNKISNCGWNWDGDGAIGFYTQSVGNMIVANLICNNRRGVDLIYFSNDNVFYHNSFINNLAQATQITEHSPSSCIWDGGYSQGGNYWSDYNGTDIKKGLYQNETGSDGVADSPYTIDVYNLDRYPLMEPYATMLGDCNDDGVVNIIDTMVVALAFGTRPDSARWNPLADVNTDGTVNLKDFFTVCTRFGKTYIPQ